MVFYGTLLCICQACYFGATSGLGCHWLYDKCCYNTVPCSFWKLLLLGALSFVRSPCWILCFSKILIMVLRVWNVDDLDAGGELDKMIQSCSVKISAFLWD